MSTPTNTDEPLDWGRGTNLNALETVMWRAEADPMLRSTVMALELLDCTPDWERFRAAHDWGARVIPRFRQRVVDGPLGLGQPHWVTDEHFDLDRHVRRLQLPEGSGLTDAFAAASQLGMEDFDRTAPPWEVILIEGLPDGKAAYALKLHHSTLDGTASTALLGMVHSRKREPSPEKPQPPVPESGDASTLGLLRRSAERDVRGLAGALKDAPSKLRGIGRPDRAASEAAAYLASLKRVLGDAGAPPSPLLAARTGRWRLGGLDVQLAPLKAAAKAHGASLNDAFLAALLGGFRRYHDELGVPIDAMPMAIPINVRKPGDAKDGNHFAAAKFAGPVAEKDPVARMAQIGRDVRAVREEPALDGLGLFAPALARLPGPVIAQIAGSLTTSNDLQASNVPGLREDAFIAGAKIERTYGYGPLPGCAAMIVLVSYGEVCCVGVNADEAAVTDFPRFGRCLVEGFGEVLDLLPDAPPAVWRT